MSPEMQTPERYEAIPVGRYADALGIIDKIRRERDDLKTQWTNSPPTVPGWYWRRGGGGYAEVHKVTKHEIDHDSDLFHDYDWSGPIPEPQEPPSGTQK